MVWVVLIATSFRATCMPLASAVWFLLTWALSELVRTLTGREWLVPSVIVGKVVIVNVTVSLVTMGWGVVDG